MFMWRKNLAYIFVNVYKYMHTREAVEMYGMKNKGEEGGGDTSKIWKACPIERKNGSQGPQGIRQQHFR